MDGNVNRYSSARGGLRVEEEVTFKRKGGWFIAKTTVLLVLLIVILLLIATALTTRYLVKTQYENGTQSAEKGAIESLPRLVRLSGDVVPLYYRLMLQPFLDLPQKGEAPFQLVGYVRILLEAREPVSTFQLHVSGLDIEQNRTKLTKLASDEPNSTSLLPASNSNWSLINIISQSLDNETELYTIEIEESLEKDGRYVLDLHYSTPIDDSLNGIYRSSYIDRKTRQRRWLAVSNFAPDYARRAFPCFDEPSYKSKFEISILRRHNMSSLSNMKQRNDQPIGDGWVWDHYETTPVMSTYLVAVFISDFSVVKTTSDLPTLSAWARSDLISQTLYASDIAGRVISFFSKYFDIPYSLPKLDLIAIPDLSPGGMENWGMITFKESKLLYEENTSSMTNKLDVLRYVSHEISHQWFGNLVTLKWWNDIWLNEGFASYMEYLGSSVVDAQWDIMDFFVVDVAQTALLADSYSSAHPLSAEITKAVDIDDYFDEISYLKGACIIRMIENALGESIFKSGIQQYIKKWSNGNVEQKDLWESLNSAFKNNETLMKELRDDIEIKEIMDSWTTQNGYPVLSVSYQDKGEISIRQEQYSLFNETSSDLWYIPVSYITMENKNDQGAVVHLWLKKEESLKIPFKKLKEDSLIIVNPNQIGFYRVNYDDKNWNLLTKTLMASGDEIFTPATRAQLIDDSFQLARAGLLKYTVPLNITKYIIDKEKSYAPWKALIRNINFLELFIWDSPEFALFQDYAKKLIQPIYKALGNEKWPVELPPQGVLRKLIANQACKYELPECLRWAKNAFEEWKNSKDPEINTVITPDSREVVICTAIRHGGKEEIDFVWSVFKNPIVHPQVKEVLMRGLTCSKTPWAINWLLSEVTNIKNNSIQIHYVYAMWKGLTENPAATGIVFEFVRNNWDSIFERFRDEVSLINSIIKGSTTALTTKTQLDDLLSFKEKNYDSQPIGLNQLEETTEYVRHNIEWREKHLPSMIDWLQDFNKLQDYNLV